MKENEFFGEGIENGIFTRHAKSARHGTAEDPLSARYKTLTEKGVEQARERARTQILDFIEKSPEGAVMFIGGQSDQSRTGETAEVYGDELAEVARGRKDLKVFTQGEIDSRRQELRGTNVGSSEVLAEITGEIRDNPRTKYIVDYPLELKQLRYAYDNRWIYTDKGPQKGKKTDYFEKLVEKYHGDHAPCVADWIENQGRLELADGAILQGPKPEKVAKEYLRGLARLQAFAKKNLPGRTVSALGVGHQWDLDAVAAYLSAGRVDKAAFESATGGTVIKETETLSGITVAPDGRTSVKYRGKDFRFAPEDKHEA